MDENSRLHRLKKLGTSLLTADLKKRSPESLDKELREFARAADYEGKGVGGETQHIWYRGVKCGDSKGYSTLRRLIYRPDGSPDFGRAQLRGSKVLYAAWNINVALDEIGASQGDIVQVIAFRLLPGVKIPYHIIGEYQSIYGSGRSLVGSRVLEQTIEEERQRDLMSFLRHVYVDSTISKDFRKRVPRRKSYEYKLSAVYSERIYLAGGPVVYPSVQNAIGRNIAIPAQAYDGNYEVLFTTLLRVQANLGFGLYRFELLGQSCGFDDDGSIDWNSPRVCPVSWTPRGGTAVDESFRGWVKPKTT